MALAAGCGAALGLVPLSFALRANNSNPDIIIGMLMHSLTWAPLGAAAGLAFAVGLGERRLIGPAVAAGLAGP